MMEIEGIIIADNSQLSTNVVGVTLPQHPASWDISQDMFNNKDLVRLVKSLKTRWPLHPSLGTYLDVNNNKRRSFKKYCVEFRITRETKG